MAYKPRVLMARVVYRPVGATTPWSNCFRSISMVTRTAYSNGVHKVLRLRACLSLSANLTNLYTHGCTNLYAQGCTNLYTQGTLRGVQICTLRVCSGVYKFVRSGYAQGCTNLYAQGCTNLYAQGMLRDVQICTLRGVQICTLS